MNKNFSLSLAAGLIATGAIAALPSSANAASFTAGDAISQGCIGLTTCTVDSSPFNNDDFFTLKASTTRNGFAPLITSKTVGTDGTLGIGIDSDPKDAETDRGESFGEIDIDETLSVGFKKAGVLKALDLSFLYRPGVYGDEVFEVALVKADGGISEGKLKVEKNGNLVQAFWSLSGMPAITLSPSNNNKGGSYRIENPFGNAAITGFSLTAEKNTNKNGKFPTGARNSDFALSRVEVKVPEPTAVLGLGVVSLLTLARRRNAVKAD